MVNRERLEGLTQQAGQKLALYAGILTPGLHMTPSFLICGAQRGGTTSMYQSLRKHPGHAPPDSCARGSTTSTSNPSAA